MDENKAFEYIPHLTLDPNAAAAAVQAAPAEVIEKRRRRSSPSAPSWKSSLRPSRPR